ncbi:hypothetical protein Geob_2055 [Geotalea daltonii FRC-32]|uniref:N-acetylglutamate synthase n=1 Tax=Geotalea daltonii (strain DSM 22248 / JCM 15807 / FRC-32) TaxID=316067 RepID=B9M8R4_GEODF|nr:hypothetical protein [Geotalea daltonii]ACM20410.1 hypothetical protein Geob_2055 [Geotalea daltonii FRC-32]
MSTINYDNRYFKSISNSTNGDAGDETVFHYRQEGDLVWATYRGGQVRFGTLVAKIGCDGALDMRYQHLNDHGQLMTGVCRSVPELLPDGHLRLHEKWRWTCRDGSEGESVIEELK